MRVIHYINQFFGGIGGEDRADASLEIREGAVGPGIGLQQEFGSKAEIVATLICGDNHFNSHRPEVLKAILKEMLKWSPEAVIAGPAFNAGRYGFACGEVAKMVTQKLEIPTFLAMHPENPGTETYRKINGVWIIPTGARAADMGAVLSKLSAFVLKVGSGAEIGSAATEGYFPNGQRMVERKSLSGAERAVNMLLNKLKGGSYETEIAVERFEQVPPATLSKDISETRVAVITTAGLVPKGNPDSFRMFNASEWRTYALPDRSTLISEDWEVIHGGFNTAYAQANPNLVLPLDALRELSGQNFGELHDRFYSITGVGTALSVAKNAGVEIAASMRDSKVDVALLVAT